MQEMSSASQSFLWSSAQRALSEGAPELSRVLLLALDERAAREKTPLPTRVTQRMCMHCFTVLVPGVNSSVRQVKHPKRPVARRRALVVRCTGCGNSAEFPMEPSPSARAAIADAAGTSAAGTAAAAAAKGNKGKRAAPTSSENDKKKKKLKPITTPAATLTEPKQSAGFYGFNFM